MSRRQRKPATKQPGQLDQGESQQAPPRPCTIAVPRIGGLIEEIDDLIDEADGRIRPCPNCGWYHRN